MSCEYYCNDKKVCNKGMPLTPLYGTLICKRTPGKCPIFTVTPEFLGECL
jgi:hypothetical protein